MTVYFVNAPMLRIIQKPALRNSSSLLTRPEIKNLSASHNKRLSLLFITLAGPLCALHATELIRPAHNRTTARFRTQEAENEHPTLRRRPQKLLFCKL